MDGLNRAELPELPEDGAHGDYAVWIPVEREE